MCDLKPQAESKALLYRFVGLYQEEDIKFRLYNICHKSTISFFNHAKSTKRHAAYDFLAFDKIYITTGGNSQSAVKPSLLVPFRAPQNSSSSIQKSIRWIATIPLCACACFIHRPNSKKHIRTRNLAFFSKRPITPKKG